MSTTERQEVKAVAKWVRMSPRKARLVTEHNRDGDQLVVKAAYVDEGPVMKRWRARARGRAVRIRKPTCHITVVLTEGAAQPLVRGRGHVEGVSGEPGDSPGKRARARKEAKS